MNKKRILMEINGFEFEFETIKEAANYLNIAPSTLSKFLNDNIFHTTYRRLEYKISSIWKTKI